MGEALSSYLDDSSAISSLGLGNWEGGSWRGATTPVLSVALG